MKWKQIISEVDLDIKPERANEGKHFAIWGGWRHVDRLLGLFSYFGRTQLSLLCSTGNVCCHHPAK